MRDHHESDGWSRTGEWLRLPVGVLTVALTLAGCASLGGDSGDGGLLSGSGSDEDSDAPVLQVVVGGGFVPMGYDFSRVPDLTVYADGRAITHGPQIEIWPPPALPNLLVTELSEEDVAALVESARDAGLLGELPEYGQPPVADAPTTTVTVTVDGTTYVHAANALGIGDGAGLDGDGLEGDGLEGDGLGEEMPGEPAMDGLSDDSRAARVALAEFVAGAHELVGTAGTGDPYEITAFGVFARPAVETTVPDDTLAEPEPGVEPELERQVLAWPLDVALAGASECVLVDGADAQTLRDSLLQANMATAFEQDGVRYDAFFRPLLPHEDGCDDLV